MILLAVLAVVAILALTCVLNLQQRSHRDAQAQWTLERRELLERIQRPERIPVQPVEGFEIPEREPDEWNMVGEIAISDKWMNGDDG